MWVEEGCARAIHHCYSNVGCGRRSILVPYPCYGYVGWGGGQSLPYIPVIDMCVEEGFNPCHVSLLWLCGLWGGGQSLPYITVMDGYVGWGGDQPFTYILVIAMWGP